MINIQSLYAKLPYFAQTVALNTHAARIHFERYGKNFTKKFNKLSQSQWFNNDQITVYQTERLKNLIHYAYETVPFYRKRYDEHGIHPNQIKDLSDISRLPILTREDVRSAGIDIISTTVKKRSLVHGHTSGTTGSPLSFYWDKQTCVYTNAVDWRQKSWGGVRYGDKIALFLGRTIVPTNKTRPPFWQHDFIHNMLWMSSFHLSTDYLPLYLKKLNEYKPAAIEGYPSTVYILARYLKSIGQTLPVKAVFTSSETLLPLQRELIEDRFQAPVFDFYGLAERICFATQCAEAHEYHLNFEYAVNEIVDSKNNPVALDQTGYLLGTSLLNYGMPFIRYKTSDITAINTDQCSCGRYMPRLQKITTKEEDIVVTPEGKLVSSSVLTHPFKPLDSVLESQIIQEKINVLHIKIVKRKDYTEADSKHLIEALHERVGNNMNIELEFVEAIPRTNSGKFRWVISNIPLPL